MERSVEIIFKRPVLLSAELQAHAHVGLLAPVSPFRSREPERARFAPLAESRFRTRRLSSLPSRRAVCCRCWRPVARGAVRRVREVVRQAGYTMTMRGEYTGEDYRGIVRYPEFSDEELAQRPSRTAGATGGVRTFMHHYHLGYDISGLSQMMLSRLQKGGWTCPACGKTFPSGADPRGK